MCLFRALNNSNSNSRIVAKVQMNNGVIANALQLITTHLQSGSRIGSCWISCSKNFNYDVEEFSIPQNKTKNHQRTMIAVIDDCQTISRLNLNELIYLKLNPTKLNIGLSTNISPLKALVVLNTMSGLVPINSIYNINISAVDELIIDFKNRSLAKKGIILKKPSKKLKLSSLQYQLSNPQYGLSNAIKAEEVLFFNQIDSSYIRYILTPLEIDILYIFSKIGSPDFSTILGTIISNNLNRPSSLHYNQMYHQLYDDLYTKNENIHDIAYRLAGKKYNILSVYSQLKSYKRELLLDIIKNIKFGSINLKTNIQQMQVNDIRIVEDVLDIIAIDKPESLLISPIPYGKLSIKTKSLPKGNPTDYSNFNDTVLAVNYSNIPVAQNINTNRRLSWLNKSADEEIQRNELSSRTNFEGCSKKGGIDKLNNVVK